MDDTPLITGSRNQPTSKQGSKILGCCCDSKRSTIIWNLLNIIYAAVSCNPDNILLKFILVYDMLHLYHNMIAHTFLSLLSNITDRNGNMDR